ncbi:MAG: hypothetical protein IJI24_02755, partial [Lachnospiraceae bacterium]|nr:hypothetical protein [Lachnospiraceae bacterium]
MILALEASTSSAKAMLYDEKENLCETITHPYEQDYSRFDRISQAEEAYRQMILTGREVLELADGKGMYDVPCAQKVEAIALVCVWHSLFLCKRDGTPVSPIYNWNHTGASKLCRSIRQDQEATKRYYHTSGCMVNAIYPFFKIEMLRQMGMPVDDCLLLSQGAYNTWRMTGTLAATRCNASGDGLLNIHTGEYNWP